MMVDVTTGKRIENTSRLSYLISVTTKNGGSLYYLKRIGDNEFSYLWTNNSENATRFPSLSSAQQEIHAKDLLDIAIRKHTVTTEIMDI